MYQADPLLCRKCGRPLKTQSRRGLAPAGRQLSCEPARAPWPSSGYGSTLDNGRDFGFDALAPESDGFFLKLAYLFRR